MNNTGRGSWVVDRSVRDETGLVFLETEIPASRGNNYNMHVDTEYNPIK